MDLISRSVNGYTARRHTAPQGYRRGTRDSREYGTARQAGDLGGRLPRMSDVKQAWSIGNGALAAARAVVTRTQL